MYGISYKCINRRLVYLSTNSGFIRIQYNLTTIIIFKVRLNPIVSFELLFIGVLGQTRPENMQVDKFIGSPPTQPYWVDYLFKIIIGIYLLVAVVVLMKFLIAMMSDTTRRIKVVFSLKFFYSGILFLMQKQSFWKLVSIVS